MHENSWLQTAEPFIDTCWRIGHRLESKYFLSAQFLLTAHWASHRPQKSEKIGSWYLGQIFKVQLNHFTALLCFSGLHSSRKYFSLHIFRPGLIEQVFDIIKVRIDNWIFRTESDRSSRPNYVLLVCKTVDDFFQQQIAQNLVQSMQISTWLWNISFHLQQKFGCKLYYFSLGFSCEFCDRCRIMPKIVSKLQVLRCVIWSGCVFRLESQQTAADAHFSDTSSI